jgi:hypothetical protein
MFATTPAAVWHECSSAFAFAVVVLALVTFMGGDGDTSTDDGRYVGTTKKALASVADQGLRLYPPWDSNPEPAD